MAPQTVVYCEGRPDPDPNGAEQGLDARVYNQVFAAEFPDALFISSGGGGASAKSAELALKILSKAFDGVTLRLLKDRDDNTDAQRSAFLAAAGSNRMLERREIENYLLDFEIVSQCGVSNGVVVDRSEYDALVPDIFNGDVKAAAQQLKNLCGQQGTVEDFKLRLASSIGPDTAIYEILKASIF